MTSISHRPDPNPHRVSLARLDRVSWDDLRMFVVAARHGSLRGAALSLQVSQSTLSRRIEHLEADLGFRVFDRLPDGIQLTREGHHVIRAAEQMEQASLSLRTFLDRDLTTRGIVRCAMTEGLGTYWMMPRLAEFTRANPYTVVDLRCTMAFSDVVRMETDVAVQLSRPTNPDLIAVKLGRLHVVPYASKKYTSIYGTPTSKEELAKHRIIEQVAPQVKESALPGLLGLESVEGVVALRTDASSAHFHAIETGIGLGFLPTYATALGPDVVPLDIGVRNELDIWMTYQADVRTIPRVSLFIDWLRTIFDPRRYPWFRDEFIHPSNFENWSPEVWDGQSRSAMVHVKDLQPLAGTDPLASNDGEPPLARAAGE